MALAGKKRVVPAEDAPNGNFTSVPFTRPFHEPEIDQYWRLFTSTNVPVVRGRDNERGLPKMRTDFEYIRVIGTNVIFEFTDGKLTGVRD